MLFSGILDPSSKSYGHPLAARYHETGTFRHSALIIMRYKASCVFFHWDKQLMENMVDMIGYERILSETHIKIADW